MQLRKIYVCKFLCDKSYTKIYFKKISQITVCANKGI